MKDLSILIPARNEMFLNLTIESILSAIEADTEIIVALDGQWPHEPINRHERLKVIYFPESIGQRAATNQACRLSDARYVMKCDAHCSFGPGFDRVLIEDMRPDWTMVPTMYNLHAFDWVCDCGHRRYQGPTKPCEKCGKDMSREIIWKPKPSPETTSMRFDTNLKFQYWREYKRHQAGELVETMSLLGACWMISRKRYWDLNICDENHGSWGQQGTEVACKTWLSGGKLICSKKTWFAHMFRTQGLDFGFPYPIRGTQVRDARKYSKHLWLGDNWPKAKHNLSWLIEKFRPPGWDYPMKKQKEIVYYTDNRLNIKIASQCRKLIQGSGLSIISVSLKPLSDFGKNIHFKGKRGRLTMFKQILAGLQASEAEVVFLCEHDVMYHRSYFDFWPERKDIFYYNRNVWKVHYETKKAVKYDSKWTSQVCAYREILIEHYKAIIDMMESGQRVRKYGPGFLPGHKIKFWDSDQPNIDIRHGRNFTGMSRFDLKDFRKKPKNWIEGRFIEFPVVEITNQDGVNNG